MTTRGSSLTRSVLDFAAGAFLLCRPMTNKTLGLLMLLSALVGCSVVGSMVGTSSVTSNATSSAATSSRSLRLSAGFFFGHDVRQLKSVVYVLDLSGSMSGRSGSAAEQMGRGAASNVGGSVISGVAGNDVGSATQSTLLDMDKKVELVKDHLNASLRGLPSDATFNIVMFSGDVQKLSPTMLTASAGTTAVVSAFVSKLKEGGSTNMKAAIEAGFDIEAHDIIVLTDGIPTDATPEEILAMVATRNADHSRRVSTVGVGADQAADFLTKLATQNGGTYQAYE